MPNRFYVQPAGDVSQGLAGLTESINQLGERKREEELYQEEQTKIAKKEAKFEAKKIEAQAIYASGDMEKMRAFAIANPILGKALTEAVEHKSKKTEENYLKLLTQVYINPTEENISHLVTERQTVLQEEGAENTEGTDTLLERFKANPDEVTKQIGMELAIKLDDKQWKNLQEAKLGKEKEKGKEWAPSDLGKWNEERQALIDAGEPLDSDIIKAYDKRIQDIESGKEEGWAPSPLKKLMDERQALLNAGEPLNSDKITAYDNKIMGTEIDLDTISDEEIDVWGAWIAVSGKMPSVGRGKQATAVRLKLMASAAKYALGAKDHEVPTETGKTPAEAALYMIGASGDTKARQGALNFLEKQNASMGSFIRNMELQSIKFKELAEDLTTFDTRLLNVPLRALRAKILGSPLQSKYDLFLTEIEQETGKLSTGSTASIAELSTSAQERWDKIHDKNLSAVDMVDLITTTLEAAKLRHQSIQEQTEKARVRMRAPRELEPADQENQISSQAEYNEFKQNNPPGTVYYNTVTKRKERLP